MTTREFAAKRTPDGIASRFNTLGATVLTGATTSRFALTAMTDIGVVAVSSYLRGEPSAAVEEYGVAKLLDELPADLRRALAGYLTHSAVLSVSVSFP